MKMFFIPENGSRTSGRSVEEVLSDSEARLQKKECGTIGFYLGVRFGIFVHMVICKSGTCKRSVFLHRC